MVVATLLVMSTHWMLSVYAICLQLQAFSAARLQGALRQPLANMPDNATELAELVVERMTKVQAEFWTLCAFAVAASGLGLVMSCLYDATFLFAALPAVIAQPFFKRLRTWGWIARRVCMARKMETFDRFHPQQQSA